jgi:hypothetical protein
MVAVQVYTNLEPRSLQVERVVEGFLVFCAEMSSFYAMREQEMIGRVESYVGQWTTRIINSARGW